MAGIGFIHFQQVELEHLAGETVFLRLDQLAGLGCCCFCSIQFIVPDRILAQPELLKSFLKATQRGAALVTEQPEQAYELIGQFKPQLRTPLYQKIFIRTLPFFSRTLLNVDRDWDKVARYAKHLTIVDDSYKYTECFTNQYVPKTPYSDLEPISCCIDE
ncbi:thiamine biosynthesis protein NMT-1 [Legionella waltersii]|uniref:Thiamine pyrimidine synthase n=1 Tax=Legionella waltersii TaxID=66969 RepID=A0A0W1AMM6_9GAMM|nr:thiamine biosynthesis protein NMT-1 [Legionella waltersii]SNV02686.1 thiamine biosynthesis protein NMT-1 [Legionella waltersii]